MHNDSLEGAGFLCRWLLLGFCGLMVLVGIAAAVLAVTRGEAGSHSSILVSDVLWRRNMPPYTWAYVDPRPSHEEAGYFLVNNFGGNNSLVAGHEGNVSFAMLVAGRETPINIQGVPYGPLASCQGTAKFVLLAPDEKPWLVDARLALAVGDDQEAIFKQAVERLGRGGQVAFVHDGKAQRFAANCVTLGGKHTGVANIWSADKKGDMAETLLVVKWFAGLDTVSMAHFVTADAQAARWALDRGCFSVHFIGPKGAVSPDKNLITYPSLLKFEESPGT